MLLPHIIFIGRLAALLYAPALDADRFTCTSIPFHPDIHFSIRLLDIASIYIAVSVATVTTVSKVPSSFDNVYTALLTLSLPTALGNGCDYFTVGYSSIVDFEKIKLFAV